MTYLFTKEGCGKCDWVKQNINLSSITGLKVMQLDADNSEALAMLAYYECVSLSEKKLPILVSEDKEIITGVGYIRKYLQERCL
ncbi:MAG: hypothetical protein QG577_2469 [Thermodesulfobacteriota bacterium]|nr:hypothetical protein [Thermodesulfobacteriota bacterium]